MTISANSPWPDAAGARPFLAFLAGLNDVPPSHPGISWDTLAQWLTAVDLGSLAFARCKHRCPELTERLQEERFLTVAQNSLNWRNLERIDASFQMAGIEAVLLKGAALAETVYDGLDQRTMSDVDIWLSPADMESAGRLMNDLDFTSKERSHRPPALQAMAAGEIEFTNQELPPTQVELHYSPFPGWWFQRAAALDTNGVWARCKPLERWHSFSQMAAEDALIHTAVHLAINHQFGMAALRSLMDIAHLQQRRRLDWALVIERARAWRVATAVWLVLYSGQQLLGLPGLENTLTALQPSYWRRQRLLHLVSPASILAGEDLRTEQARYLLLLLLVDRPQDAGHLIARTVWPEDAWLDARYGGGVDRWQHLRRLIAHGEV